MIMEKFGKQLPMEEYIARFLDRDRIRGFCNACSRHGRCWACPPFGSEENGMLLHYTMISVRAVKLYPGKYTGQSPDGLKDFLGEIIRQHREKEDAVLLEEEAALEGRAFFAGTCLLCPEDRCMRISGRRCIHPEKVRPSLEALGFDIVATASELFGIEMKWGTGGNPPEYLTLVSGLAFTTKGTVMSR